MRRYINLGRRTWQSGWFEPNTLRGCTLPTFYDRLRGLRICG